MRSAAVLVWKEVKEAQGAFIAGSAIFVAIPALLSVLHVWIFGGHFGDIASGLVVGLGGLYALLVGVHSASSDQKPGLEPFWRSRPIGLARWVVVKWLTGATVVLLTTAAGLILEILITRNWSLDPVGDQLSMLLGHSFTLLLVYSLAFLLGSLAGDPLKAALMSLAGGLLVYFLPVLVPRLEPWSAINLLADWPRPRWIEDPTQAILIGYEERSWLHTGGVKLLVPRVYGPFILGNLGLSVIVGFVAWIALQRRLRIEVGQKVMVSSLGGVALVLLALAGEQVGSNLELQSAEMLQPGSRNCVVAGIDQRGGAGVLARFRWPERWIEHRHELSLQRFDLSANPPRLGSPVQVPGKFLGYHYWGNDLRLAWAPDRADRAYLLAEGFEPAEAGSPPAGSRSAIGLLTVSLDPGGSVVHRLELLPHLPGAGPADRPLPWPYVHRGLLYLTDAESKPRTRLLRIDLRRADFPVLLDVLEIDFHGLQVDGEGLPRSQDLFEIPGLDARERLEATFALQSRYLSACIAGDLLATFHPRRGLETFKIDLSEPGKAFFKPLGQRRPTPLERLRNLLPGSAALHQGLYYALTLDGMTVFDVRDPARPRRIGHYAAPREDFRALAPLSTGEVLVAGRSLHLVAAPAPEKRDDR